jgi:glycosyltransferase involved in cell wall biosynthesis
MVVNTINILHITTFVQGGAGRILYELASCQKANNNNVFVITSATEEPGYNNYSEYIDRLQNEHIPVFKFDSTFKRDVANNISVAQELRNIINEEAIDIIHAHAAIPAMVAIIARAGTTRYIPVIQTMHGWGTNKTQIHEQTDITIMNSLDKVVTVSLSDKKLLESKGLHSNKIVTIYNGIEKRKESEVDLDILDDLKKIKNNSCKVIGCIGTICCRKNQELLLDAINLLSHELKIVCIFIGEGDQLDYLKDKSKQYGLDDKIKFYGYRENAGNYLKYFDALVLPSTSEGLSITVLEAFREQIIVVTSDIDNFSEIIVNNESGYLFNNNDVHSLCNILKNVLFNRDLKSKELVRNNAFKKYQDLFTKEKMIKAYDELYQSALRDSV